MVRGASKKSGPMGRPVMEEVTEHRWFQRGIIKPDGSKVDPWNDSIPCWLWTYNSMGVHHNGRKWQIRRLMWEKFRDEDLDQYDVVIKGECKGTCVNPWHCEKMGYDEFAQQMAAAATASRAAYKAKRLGIIDPVTYTIKMEGWVTTLENASSGALNNILNHERITRENGEDDLWLADDCSWTGPFMAGPNRLCFGIATNPVLRQEIEKRYRANHEANPLPPLATPKKAFKIEAEPVLEKPKIVEHKDFSGEMPESDFARYYDDKGRKIGLYGRRTT